MSNNVAKDLGFFVFSMISLALSASIIFVLAFKVRGGSFICRMIECLHVFLIIELLVTGSMYYDLAISSEKYLEKNHHLCNLGGYFFYFSALGNLFCSCGLSAYGHVLFFYSNYEHKIFSDRKIYIVFGLLILCLPLLPIFFNRYQVTQQLCIIGFDDSETVALGFVTLYGWVVLLLVLSFYSFAVIMKQVVQIDMTIQYLKHYGSYPIITVLFWVPRVLPRFGVKYVGTTNGSMGLLLIALCSFAYSILFWQGYHDIKGYEANFALFSHKQETSASVQNPDFLPYNKSLSSSMGDVRLLRDGEDIKTTDLGSLVLSPMSAEMTSPRRSDV